MQYKVACGNMSLIANMARNGDLSTFGVTREDFNKLCGNAPWLANDRNRMRMTLESMLSSTMDVIGVPRFQMPAEFVAAGIALFIAPINIQTCCRFMERIPTAESLGRAADDSDVMTARQLFALCVQLVSDPVSSHAKELFERNTGIRMENMNIYGEKDNDNNTGQKNKK